MSDLFFTSLRWIIYVFGKRGRYLGMVTSENTIWTYTVRDKSWNTQGGSIQPTRLEYGGTLDISHHTNT